MEGRITLVRISNKYGGRVWIGLDLLTMESRGGMQFSDDEFQTFLLKDERSGDGLLVCGEGMCSMTLVV